MWAIVEAGIVKIVAWVLLHISAISAITKTHIHNTIAAPQHHLAYEWDCTAIVLGVKSVWDLSSVRPAIV